MAIGEGYVHVYTGEGKGKTTAALGLTLRALGAGLKVFFSQFLKQGEFSEIKALRRFKDQVEIRQYGAGKFVRGKPSEEDVAHAFQGLEEVRSAFEQGAYDLVVMDEINVAVYFQVVSLEDVLNLIDQRPRGMELVLTGRWARPEVIAKADLVTEMTNIKHYYEKGVKARVGIEK